MPFIKLTFHGSRFFVSFRYHLSHVDFIRPVEGHGILIPPWPVGKPIRNTAILYPFHQKIGFDVEHRRSIFCINKGSIYNSLFMIHFRHLYGTYEKWVWVCRRAGAKNTKPFRTFFKISVYSPNSVHPGRRYGGVRHIPEGAHRHATPSERARSHLHDVKVHADPGCRFL